MGFWRDFKAFVSRGNVVDMAVGVVVGGAFSKIVSSLVADLITPLISLVTKGVTLTELYLCLNPDDVAGQTFSRAAYPTVALAKEAGYATLNYGNFLQNVLDFLLIALCIFTAVRLVAKGRSKLEALRKTAETPAVAEAPAAPAEPAETTETILKDIRALLQEKEQ